MNFVSYSIIQINLFWEPVGHKILSFIYIIFLCFICYRIFSGVIIVPVVMATFKKHYAIYTFRDNSFFGTDGNLNITYIIQQEVIQISLVFMVVIILTFMEAKFNRVNLNVVLKRKTKTQYLSEALINLWAVLLFLSSVKTTPNYLQCSDMTMCNCRFTADQDVTTKYGCP